jgi:uncharacterized protein (DUF169 family)
MDIKTLDEALARHVRPATFPPAIRMLKAGEALPPKVKRPQADLGEQIAICQGFAMSRRYGWAMARGIGTSH